MKEKIIMWAVSNLLKLIPEKTEENSTQKLNSIIIDLYSNTVNPYLLDREINGMIFNAKYIDLLKESGTLSITPYDLLTTFYSKANKGDNSFMKDPFYRILARSKDAEIRKLNYRLKRN